MSTAETGVSGKKPDKPMPAWTAGSDRKTAVFFILLGASILLYNVLSQTMLGDDYFMIANWREFLKNGFYTTDPLSMHNDYRCSLEKWMSCAIVWFLYTKTGLIGLKAALAALSALIAYFLYRLCFYTSKNRVMSGIFTMIMLLTGYVFLNIRPQTVTTLLLILEVLFLEHFANENNWKWLLPLPALAWLEMQLHSTIWPCFFMVLLPYVVDCTFSNWRPVIEWKQKKQLILTALLSFGVLFLNPYGSWSVFYIFRSYGCDDMNHLISELQLTTLNFTQWQVWLVIFGITLAFGDKKAPLRYWLLYLGFYAFGWTARRNMIFTLLLTGFVPCWMLRRFRPRIHWNLLPVIPVVVASAIYVGLYSYNKEMTNPDGMDIAALNWLAERTEASDEKIYCDFNSGSYAEYLGFHPYVDGRAEVFTKNINEKEDLLHEYRQLSNGTLYYRDFANKYHFDYLVINKDVEPLLYTCFKHDEDYRIIYSDDKFNIFQPVSDSALTTD